MCLSLKSMHSNLFSILFNTRAIRASEFLFSIVFVEFAYYYRMVALANLFREIVFIAIAFVIEKY